jgi:hypothetical protein
VGLCISTVEKPTTPKPEGFMRGLHPEEFTQLPNGNWIDNARAIKH